MIAFYSKLQEILHGQGVASVLQPYRIPSVWLVGESNASPVAIKAALYERFGGNRKRTVGSVKRPGPHFEVVGHAWDALAHVVTYVERRDNETRL